MPLPFTGTPEWRETIAGPANTDDVTGPSVSDMGVLLADRGQWQKQGTIGHKDTKQQSYDVSGGTGFQAFYTDRIALDVAQSRVLVTQVLPRVEITDGDVTVEPVLFDESGDVVEVASTYAIELLQDDVCPQLVIVAGYESVAAGIYSFGIKVTCSGAAKFEMTFGYVKTIVQAYPLEGT